MRALFTAAGSIGSRHIRNLTDVSKKLGIPLDIDVIRKSDRILPNDIKELVRNEIRNEIDLDDKYDIAFITDETKDHFDSIVYLKDRCTHMFIEKPVLDNASYDISQIMPPPGAVYYVACPIRFSRYYEELKKVITNNDVYSVRIIFSSYMPNWQKGRDYRKSFRCFTSKGGGVDIDSLHEIDYMTSLFGVPESISRVAGKYSNLEMDAPDLAVFIFEYDHKVIEMHLDYFGRTNNRRVELFAKDDVIVVDYNKHIVEHQLSGNIYDYGVDDQFYQKEMKYFISLVQSDGRMKNINSLENALTSLKLAKGYNK